MSLLYGFAYVLIAGVYSGAIYTREDGLSKKDKTHFMVKFNLICLGITVFSILILYLIR